MSDRGLIAAGAASVALAVICCVAPLLAAILPLAAFGAWMAGAGLIVLPLVVIGLVLVAWILRRRWKGESRCETTNHKERVKS